MYVVNNIKKEEVLMKSKTKIVLAFTIILSILIGSFSYTSAASTVAGTPQSVKGEDLTANSATDYSDSFNWVAHGGDQIGGETVADVFFVAPTVYMQQQSTWPTNMPLYNDPVNSQIYSGNGEEPGYGAVFAGAVVQQMGIYDNDQVRFFAPVYQQIGLNVYAADEATKQAALDKAFADVQKSFEYYMENYNNGRPVILAGFSQGAYMCIRLLNSSSFNSATDTQRNETRKDQMVACYAIGWNYTQADADSSGFQGAKGESDTGVVVSYNTEAEYLTDSVMVPNGTENVLAINPLNWTTDSTPAGKGLNLGAVTFEGVRVATTTPGLTGGYIDTERGTLKVADTDIQVSDYPDGKEAMGEGSYHMYDYTFFYTNLQKNVKTRLLSYLYNISQQVGSAKYVGESTAASISVSVPEGYHVVYSNDGGATYTLDSAPVYSEPGYYETFYKVYSDLGMEMYTGSDWVEVYTETEPGVIPNTYATEIEEQSATHVKLKELENTTTTDANAVECVAQYGIQTPGSKSIRWQSSPIFERLEIGKEYTFYTRYVVSDNTPNYSVTAGNAKSQYDPAEQPVDPGQNDEDNSNSNDNNPNDNSSENNSSTENNTTDNASSSSSVDQTPKTGDNSFIAFCFVLVGGSIVAIAAFRRKRSAK